MADFAHSLGNLEPLVREYGAAAVTFILTFESLGAPLPGESLLIFASFLAGRGELSLPVLMVSAWMGAVMGDNVGYLIGRRLGRTLVLRYGAKVGINAERLTRVEAVFARYGAFTVGFARFMNVLRQLNGIAAGILKMDWKRFLVFNALGGALWVATWTLTGFYVAKHVSNVRVLAHDLELGGGILGVALLIAASVYVFWRPRHRI